MMEINESIIFYGVLSFMCIEFAWEFYLDFRQRKVQKENTNIPGELIGIISKETFDKARLYAIDKRNYEMVRDIITVTFSLTFLSCNGMYLIWELGGKYITYFGYEPNESNEIIQSAAFSIVLNFVNNIVGLPLSVYYTFVLEERHGFNKQTLSFFIKDKLKTYTLQQVLFVPVSCGIIYIVKIGGDYFFLYIWLFIMLVTIFIYTIYPDFIAPLFDKYIQLPPGELRSEIEVMAKSLNFPLSDLYVVVGSKRSAHSNAYFFGFLKKKRIVLFDTLLKDFDANADEKKEMKVEEEKKEIDKDKDKDKKGCDNYEILAVVGHEMGHWKLNHTIKNLIIGELNLLLVLMIFAKLFRCRMLYRAFGFQNSMPVLIGFLIVLHYVFTFYFALIKFVMGKISRHFEFQADKFVKSLGRAQYLKKALIKLNTDNLEFPIYDGWFSAWYNSHPPLLERLQALDKDE